MFDSKKNIAHKRKSGFGIVEVLVSIVVLGFLYVALLHLQKGNDEAVLRLRGRDGAVEVAQEIMDELRAKGVSVLPSATVSSENPSSNVVDHADVTRTWERGLGGTSSIAYKPTIKVVKDLVSESSSNYETAHYVYAKEVSINVSWNFKGTPQSIDLSGVIR